jgi:mannose-6-phosphate isomerase-like protein (cupin superfamily)
VTLPPDLDIPAALAEIHRKLPGLGEVLEPDHPGMHRTDTIDYEVVISGEVWLELDDGQEVHLKPGDTVVQNGTRHAWRNKSSEPCVLAVTLIRGKSAKAVVVKPADASVRAVSTSSPLIPDATRSRPRRLSTVPTGRCL